LGILDNFHELAHEIFSAPVSYFSTVSPSSKSDSCFFEIGRGIGVLNIWMDNPALMTLPEYYALVNEKDKMHPDSAYDVGLDALNRYDQDPKEYDKFLKRLKIRGINFDFYLKVRGKEVTVGVFNEDGERVAASQDEWGAMLIRVAQEYRGFGLGPILGKIARTIEPLKPSGGFTYAGRKNFIKTHREMVRDALKSGLYTKLVRQGKMSVERVKEIVDSAKLSVRQPAAKGDYSSTPKDWVLYVGDSDFILYDRKLKDMIDEVGHWSYWTEKMVKGLVLVREPREGQAIVVRFGGDTDKIKTLMISCAMSYCKNEGIAFNIDPEDRKYVDPKYGAVSEESHYLTGFERYTVTISDDIPNFAAWAPIERQFRKSFDQYGEFKNSMMEIAYSKFEPEPPPQKDSYGYR
jgi:hypothetical protein